MAPGGQKVGAGDVEMAGNGAQHILDHHVPGLAFGHQVAHRVAGFLDGCRAALVFLRGDHPVERSFQIAPRALYPLGQKTNDFAGDFSVRAGFGKLPGPGRQHLLPHLGIGRAHLHHQPAGQTRANTLVQRFQARRHLIAGNDHLAF